MDDLGAWDGIKDHDPLLLLLLWLLLVLLLVLLLLFLLLFLLLDGKLLEGGVLAADDDAARVDDDEVARGDEGRHERDVADVERADHVAQRDAREEVADADAVGLWHTRCSSGCHCCCC